MTAEINVQMCKKFMFGGWGEDRDSYIEFLSISIDSLTYRHEHICDIIIEI